jgi:flagellar biosynthetic protein FliP
VRRRVIATAALLVTAGAGVTAFAAEPSLVPRMSLEVGGPATTPTQVVGAVKVFVLLTVLSLAPAILLSMTSFTRFVIVLGFVRQSLGTQGMPPNQVLIALALFLTFFVMSPVMDAVHQDAVEPFMRGEIDQEQALDRALEPLRGFMLRQTRETDLALMVSLSGEERPATRADVATKALVPAFIISELKTAFQMGFLLYLPFLVIDLVVASVLAAFGMMMLPPVLISLPFKVMLFVLVDGWNLLVGSLVRSVA